MIRMCYNILCAEISVARLLKIMTEFENKSAHGMHVLSHIIIRFCNAFDRIKVIIRNMLRKTWFSFFFLLINNSFFSLLFSLFFIIDKKFMFYIKLWF
jgi:hypothetical protein